MTCAEWEIQIERRWHGALAPEDAAALDAHLPTCASCRTYADMVQGTERTMQNAAAVANIDWEKVRAGVNKGARTARRELWVGAAWALLYVAVAASKMPSPGEMLARPIVPVVLLAALAPALALTALAFRHARGRALSAGAARKSDGAALGWVRGELDTRIRARRNGLFLEVALCAVVAAVALFNELPGEVRIMLGLGMAVVVADAAWAAFRALPRLQRERGELGD